ncbi:MAG: hypothetical protein LBE62_05245 [Azonexus sp.]|jgi:hypothetical protein|nr:hypothetical protein [Azonexus sp.]
MKHDIDRALSQGDTMMRILALPIDTFGDCFNLDNSPVFTVFAAGLIFATALLVIIWLIKRVFFWKAAKISVFAVAAVAFGAILGLWGTFAVPRFESMYAPYGMDLPTPTLWLTEFRYFLWTPLLLIVVIWQQLQINKPPMRWLRMAIFSGETLLFLLVLVALYSPFFPFGICID